MDKSASINYLEKKQAMNEASNVMENALKTIADIFKNVQADFSRLVDDNNRLELLVKKLSDNKNGCVLCTKKIIRKNRLPHCSKIKLRKTNDDFVSRCDDGESPGIVENTQIEERILTKAKSRLKDKRSNSQINKNESDNCSLPVGTQSKSKQKSCFAKVTAEIVILTDNRTSQRCKNISQLTDEKKDEKISEIQLNEGKIDSEYLDIDATLFEQPFSQEQNPGKNPQPTANAEDIETLREGAQTTSPAQSFLDDVVEVSPKKNILRKKNWLRQNRPTAKSCMNDSNSDLAETSTADNNNKGKGVRKSLKYITSREKEGDRDDKEAKVKTKAQTPTSRINTLPSQMHKKDATPALMNESTFFSLPPTEVNAPANTAKSNVQTDTRGENSNLPAVEILIRSQSGEPTSDETYFLADETYCPAHEIPQKQDNNEEKEEIVNKAKRKFSDISTSDTENNINPTSTELELDIGDMSDWDTDISCDKWASNTPQKRVLVNSFDMVPAKKEVAPKFATKGPVVRKKAERAKLRGWDCENCAKYYENMGLSERELAARKNQCSRHRSKFNERYFTPPGLWDLRFPDTQTSSQD